MTKEENTKYIYEHGGILAMCQELHMNLQGSSDTLSMDKQREYTKTLLKKLKFWNNSPNNNAARYDKAVETLILTVVMEHQLIDIESDFKHQSSFK